MVASAAISRARVGERGFVVNTTKKGMYPERGNIDGSGKVIYVEHSDLDVSRIAIDSPRICKEWVGQNEGEFLAMNQALGKGHPRTESQCRAGKGLALPVWR